MADDQTNAKSQKDDVRQAYEEGDPKATGRTRHPVDQQEDTGRNNPDASGKLGQDQRGKSATTPHRESGDGA